MFCPDREEIRNLTQQLVKTLEEVDRERERSRDKVKKEEAREEDERRRDGVKREVKVENGLDYVCLDDCALCGYVICKLDEIKKVVPP